MSGGSYDYCCFKISEMADNLRGCVSNPRRAAFQKLLRLVADAAKDIEWVDSCDCSPGDENAAIDRCFAFLKSNPEMVKKAESYDTLIELLKGWIK